MEDKRRFVSLLSCLVSQSLLSLLLSLSSSPRSLSFDSSPGFNGSLFVLLHEFLSTQQIAAFLGVKSVSRKRKRTRLQRPDPDLTRSGGDAELGGPCRELSLTRSLDSFRTCFKMKSETFEWLLGLLEPLLECRDPIGSSINLSPEVRLVIGLYRLANGSDYSEIADRFGVTKTVARFCAKQLCRVLCTNFRFWVAFPGPDDLKSVSISFEEQFGLPNCCGVLASARFEVVGNNADKLLDEMPETETVVVQTVVDSSSRILSLVVSARGDKSDYTLLKSSTLYKDIEERKLLSSSMVNVDGIEINQYLIGHYGYPLLRWLMVPFSDDTVVDAPEEKFNESIRLMRVCGSKTIACLKNWGVLSKPIQEEFKTAVAFIAACSILHNVLLMREDDSAFCGDLGGQLWEEQSSWHHGLEESSLFDDTAAVTRDSLATKASEFHTSRARNPPKSC